MPSEGTRRRREELRVSEVSVPPLFRCPISLELMTDPVSLCTGVSYERACIEKWLDDGNNVCPATMQVLANQELIPNHTLRSLIHEWCASAHGPGGPVRLPTPRPVADPHGLRRMMDDIRLNAATNNNNNRLEALRSLRNLARAGERNRRCMRAAGVLGLLVGVLDGSAPAEGADDGRTEALQEALGAVACFSFEDEDRADLLARPSVLRTVEWLLCKGNLDARMSAAAFVEKLASADRSCARGIGSREGFTDGLLKLFEENARDREYPAAAKASLKALLPLCGVARNRAKIAEAGAVPGLVELLPGADRGMTEQALAILEALSTTSEGRSAIVGHALAVPTIVRSLLVVSDTATEYAVGIMLAICFNSADDELLAEVVQMGTFEKLLVLLQMECSPRTKHKANELLRLLSPVHHDDSSSCPSSLEL